LAVANLHPGVRISSVVAVLAKNNVLKEACTQLLRDWSVPGTLVKRCSPSTWEVLWELGTGAIYAKHQVRWILNTNHCSIVSGVTMHVQLPRGGAAADEGATDADPHSLDTEDSSSDSSHQVNKNNSKIVLLFLVQL